MKRRLSVAVALACTLMVLFAANGAAQSEKGKSGPPKDLGGPGGVIAVNGVRDENLPPPPEGPTPRTADGKPDLSGVWLNGNYSFSNLGGPLPLQPWAQELEAKRRADQGKDDPEAQCLPTGVPRITPYPMQIIQSPTVIAMLFEGPLHTYRLFYLNRGHIGGDDFFPTWMGDSVAHWEGDTLVVDTIGLNDKTWLSGRGTPHTEQLHVIERYTRPDLGHLDVEITMDDPGAFTRPHTFKRQHILSTTWEIHEFVCNEFNIDADRLVGR
jgi:hypothetical protein